MAHWSERYIGRPYIEGKFDCGDFAVLVQKEIFGRDIYLPSDHGANAFGRSAAVHRNADDLATRISPDCAVDGDAIVLLVKGRVQHVGLLADISGQRWVIHNQQRIGVHLTRFRDLAIWGYKVEGFYRWA